MTKHLYETPDDGQNLITEKLRVPMGRWGEAHEIGQVVAFLASDDAAYITGQPIIVDGGFMARLTAQHLCKPTSNRHQQETTIGGIKSE